jgi:hypothetical protein
MIELNESHIDCSAQKQQTYITAEIRNEELKVQGKSEIPFVKKKKKLLSRGFPRLRVSRYQLGFVSSCWA